MYFIKESMAISISASYFFAMTNVFVKPHIVFFVTHISAG
jgi:hypothetical protein